jgi:hypothetical protein
MGYGPVIAATIIPKRQTDRVRLRLTDVVGGGRYAMPQPTFDQNLSRVSAVRYNLILSAPKALPMNQRVTTLSDLQMEVVP